MNRENPMKQHTSDEKIMLGRVNDIGMEIDTLPEENFVFVLLSPYLDDLMKLLKQLKPTEMQRLFIQYEGVMKVMRMIEDSAKQMEKDLGI